MTKEELMAKLSEVPNETPIKINVAGYLHDIDVFQTRLNKDGKFDPHGNVVGLVISQK